MRYYSVNDTNNKPKPFVTILGYDEKTGVHEYWFANDTFHTPDGVKTDKDIILWCYPPHPSGLEVEYNIFDEEETYDDCTVQILRNTTTGETSIGWWRNDNKPYNMEDNNNEE